MITNRSFSFKDIKIANHGPYVLQSVSNLETGSASSRKINYIGVDGCRYKDIYYNDRVFEISGFIEADDAETMVRLKRRLISKCSLKESFILKYYNRSEKYIAECFFDKLPTFGVRNQWHLPFKLYLRIPGFYWQSAQPQIIGIYSFEDTVTDSFTLPCVFTERSTVKTVTNLGDCAAFPVFKIECENPGAESNILIENLTTGKCLKLHHAMSEGETVIIDVANQRVTSSIGGNITNTVDIEAEFFELLQGSNEIRAISTGSVVTLEFRENFLGV